MEWVNVTAKSLPEAIDLALDNLGVDEAEAEIEVLEEPKQGLFGRTRGNARVKARVKPRATRPKIERNRNRRRRSEGSSGKSSSENRNRSDGKRRDGGQDRQQSKGRNKGRGRAEKSASVGSDNGGETNRGGGSDRGGGSNRGGRQNRQRQDETPAQEVPVEEVSANIERFLTGLADAFGVDGPVHVDSDNDDGLIGKIDGQHGLLVGPKGRTLDAIQELARVTAQRSTPSSIRIKVDVGGYREMRTAALQKFVVGVADSARADGKERSLEPMSSADRKVVHDALNGMEGVETRSAGTDPRRHVVVVPLAGPEDAPVEASAEDVEGVDDIDADAAEADVAVDEVDEVDAADDGVGSDDSAVDEVDAADHGVADASADNGATDDVAGDDGAADGDTHADAGTDADAAETADVGESETIVD